MSIVSIKPSLTERVNEVGVPTKTYTETALLSNGKSIQCGASLEVSKERATAQLERDGKRVCTHWFAHKDGQAAVVKAMQ